MSLFFLPPEGKTPRTNQYRTRKRNVWESFMWSRSPFFCSKRQLWVHEHENAKQKSSFFPGLSCHWDHIICRPNFSNFFPMQNVSLLEKGNNIGIFDCEKGESQWSCLAWLVLLPAEFNFLSMVFFSFLFSLQHPVKKRTHFPLSWMMRKRGGSRKSTFFECKKLPKTFQDRRESGLSYMGWGALLYLPHLVSALLLCVCLKFWPRMTWLYRLFTCMCKKLGGASLALLKRKWHGPYCFMILDPSSLCERDREIPFFLPDWWFEGVREGERETLFFSPDWWWS